MVHKVDEAGNFYVGYPSDNGLFRFYSDIVAGVSACYGSNAAAFINSSFYGGGSGVTNFRFDFRPSGDSLSGSFSTPSNVTSVNSGNPLNTNARLGVAPFGATPSFGIRATNGGVLYSTGNSISNYPTIVMSVFNTNSACFYASHSATKILIWLGNLSNVLSSSNAAFPETCAILTISSDNPPALAKRTLNDSSFRNILTSGVANYSISCSDGQSGGTDGWTTDLYLRDNNSITSNAAIGRCDNLLLAKGSSFVLGEYYKINSADVTGASRLFICAANFGTDKILMRVKEA